MGPLNNKCVLYLGYSAVMTSRGCRQSPNAVPEIICGIPCHANHVHYKATRHSAE